MRSLDRSRRPLSVLSFDLLMKEQDVLLEISSTKQVPAAAKVSVFVSPSTLAMNQECFCTTGIRPSPTAHAREDQRPHR
jgi:hypothetical protein